jgi:hypothetical protein
MGAPKGNKIYGPRPARATYFPAILRRPKSEMSKSPAFPRALIDD